MKRKKPQGVWEHNKKRQNLGSAVNTAIFFQPATIVSIIIVRTIICTIISLNQVIPLLNTPKITAAAFYIGFIASRIHNNRVTFRASAFRSFSSPSSFSSSNKVRRGRERLTLFWRQHPIMAYHPSSDMSAQASPSDASIHDQQQQQQQQKHPSSPKMEAMVARRVSASLDSLKECGERLRSGHLVSFPTETVYGLGCHALDAQAVSKVYAAKERPYTDPLIVHVCESSQALHLWDVTSGRDNCGSSYNNEKEERERLHILNLLCRTFWPGPLTIVAPANVDRVPQVVMANTSYVAVRYPSHPIAQSLIRLAGVPIAAPSANKFGHVSPTRPDHVLCDLGMEDVWVIDPALGDSEGHYDSIQNYTGMTGEEDILSSSLARICHVGVESTVVRVNFATRTIELLRHGAISQADLESCLADDSDLHFTHQSKMLENGATTSTTSNNGTYSTLNVSKYIVIDNTDKKILKSKTKVNEEDVSNVYDDDALHVPQVAPGQAIRHYSPNVLSYMISPHRYSALLAAKDDTPPSLSLTEKEITQLSKSVIIDFGGKLKSLQSYCLDYQDLSVAGDAKEGASRIFEVLRWSERIDGAERVYFPQLPSLSMQGQELLIGDSQESSGLLFALKDKLKRAASGIVVDTFK